MGFKSVAPSKDVDTSSLAGLGRSITDIAQWAYYQFNGVQAAFSSTDPAYIWNNPPPKPRRGTTAYADGVHWNPGQGEGPYFFNGTAWFPEFQYANTTPGAIVRVVQRVFTASGTYTPTAGILYAIMECIGAGAAGGGVVGVATGMGGGGGGGGGAYSRRLVTAALIGVSQVVTVGPAGVAGAVGNNPGGNGGTTSIGSLITAPGGTGGTAQNGVSNLGLGGAGGLAGTGDFSVPGQHGQNANYNTAASGVQGSSGNGGSAGLGFGAGAAGVAQSGGSLIVGNSGSLYGGGGSGGSFCAVAGNQAGGPGAIGLALVTEFCNA